MSSIANTTVEACADPFPKISSHAYEMQFAQ